MTRLFAVMDALEARLDRVVCYVRWFRPGRCELCGRWTWWILRSENSHEECWLETK